MLVCETTVGAVGKADLLVTGTVPPTLRTFSTIKEPQKTICQTQVSTQICYLPSETIPPNQDFIRQIRWRDFSTTGCNGISCKTTNTQAP